ncbi:EthD family reductase [Xenophilus sp.]|uniref:EthD family reductase n=1 Tax=Xenophilus sp. TaxID=1873499 RepID=UPI0037DD5A0B
MIRVSVMYPFTEGARFDHDYYRDQHMPMFKARLGDTCRSVQVDRGLAGPTPGSKPLYEAMCHVLCDSVEAFQAAFGPHAKEINGDVKNYTDIRPVMQISSVVA